MFINLNLGEIIWKERLWQMFLVAILGLVLTMCSRSGGNNNTSSSDTVNAEGISTVSVSSMPSLKVESLPSMTITMDNSSATPVAVTSFPIVTLDNSSTLTVYVANAGPSNISGVMACLYWVYSSGVMTYMDCDASDDTVLSNGEITHDAAFAAGWKLVGPACGGIKSTGNPERCFLFHK